MDGDGYFAEVDCDDSDPTVHPGADEHCDNVDEDCDGAVDEDAVDADGWYADDDGDGYGGGGVAETACDQPDGLLPDEDCDDDDPSVNPEAEEVCNNGTDDDCAGDGDRHCHPLGESSLGDAVVTWRGSLDNDRVGYQVSLNPDLTGDGLADPFILSPGADMYVGFTVDAVAAGDHDLESSAYVVSGPTTGGAALLFGTALGDQDGDGINELLVCDPSYGDMYIFTGPVTGDLTLSDATDSVWSVGTNAVGGICAALTDATGDDLADILSASSSSHTDFTTGELGANTGAAYVFAGPVTGTLDVEDASAVLEHDIALEDTWLGLDGCVGDLDGDGVGDVAVSAPTSGYEFAPTWIGGGVVYIAQGPVTGMVMLADYDGTMEDATGRIDGSTDDSQTGYGVDCAGDVDGDGAVDLLISTVDPSEIDLYSGLPDGAIERDTSTWRLSAMEGTALAVTPTAASDLNGDGHHDVVASLYDEDDYRGDIGIYYGPLTGSATIDDAGAVLAGEGDHDFAGDWHGLAGGQDVDGDGYDDLLIGAMYNDEAATDAGAAYLIYGGGSW